MEAITLFELNSRVRQILKRECNGPMWITAEITEIQFNQSGHCYLQLVDKGSNDDHIVATARGTIWAFVFRTLRPYFETTTGCSLAKGMRVMLNVEVVFHELYGYSLNIKDIDPTYTLGDLERKRKEILKRLEMEGIIDMNRSLEFPLLPKTIAVISSPTAAGYGDFMKQLEQNPYGYCFQVKLFPAVMQGEKTTDSIIAALEQIYAYESVFDVVVIIRGGGSQTDLSSFDSYDLAANVAQFPLPVIAGIGHERDETIVDRVACMRVKTPTAAAAYLIGLFQEQEKHLMTLRHRCMTHVRELLNQEHTRQLLAVTTLKRSVQMVLTGNMTRLKWFSQHIGHLYERNVQFSQNRFEQFRKHVNFLITILLEKHRNQMLLLGNTVRQKTEQLLSNQKQHLKFVDQQVKLLDPKRVLERGYSITRCHGKILTGKQELKSGDVLETELTNGRIYSEVILK